MAGPDDHTQKVMSRGHIGGEKDSSRENKSKKKKKREELARENTKEKGIQNQTDVER